MPTWIFVNQVSHKKPHFRPLILLVTNHETIIHVSSLLRYYNPAGYLRCKGYLILATKVSLEFIVPMSNILFYQVRFEISVLKSSTKHKLKYWVQYKTNNFELQNLPENQGCADPVKSYRSGSFSKNSYGSGSDQFLKIVMRSNKIQIFSRTDIAIASKLLNLGNLFGYKRNVGARPVFPPKTWMKNNSEGVAAFVKGYKNFRLTFSKGKLT